jgi:hypothetical protein
MMARCLLTTTILGIIAFGDEQQAVGQLLSVEMNLLVICRYCDIADYYP